MYTRISHRIAALGAATAICASLFGTVAGSMPVAALDTRPHIALPTVTVLASKTGTVQTTAQAAPSVTCANS